MPHTTLIQLGDFHAGPGPRNADRFRALDQVIAEGEHNPRLGAWLWPGDLNHARMSIEDRNALKERIKRMAGRAPVVICYGNHDLPGDLDIFADLRAVYPIHVIAEPLTLRLTLATGDEAAIFVLPYPTKGGLAAAGVAPGAVVDEARHALEAIFREAAAQLRAAEAKGAITLMIGHVNVAGSITSVGQPNIGAEIEVDQPLLDLLGPIYKGLNHIHKGQSIGGADYPGSICRLDWGEIEAKRYLAIHYDSQSYDIEPCALDVPPMYHVEGELTRDGFSWRVTAGPAGEVQPAPDTWKGCEVRVRYRFRQSEKTVLNEAAVLAEFADTLKLEAEPIAVPDRALRAPAVAAARTLADKLRAWCDTSQVVVTDEALRKLGRLEHGDPQQLLADVQRDIAAIEASEREAVTA